MNATTEATPVVEDGFEVYYAEKLWEMIPAVYRFEDGIAARPEVLRSLVLILAKQAAILRRSQDHLWDDAFIELCNEWAVPYISELLGTRLVPASNHRGRRIDVAKTIYYRRRKGTMRVLEELMSDITGWDGKVVEQFKHLARPRHGLDPQPAAYAGRITGTQPGGWADLRQAQGAELADGPYDEYFHTPDFRQQRGLSGRYNIPKLAFYLYRLVAYKVEDVTPFPLGDGLGFSFDPSGRSIPLFNRRERAESVRVAYTGEVIPGYDWDQWKSAMEWELPMPIRCRLLAETNFEFTAVNIAKLALSPGLSPAEVADLTRLIGYPIMGEARLKDTLASLPNAASFLSPPLYEVLKGILTAAVVDNCGKQQLLPQSLTVQSNDIDIPFAETTAGALITSPAPPSWDTANVPAEKVLVIDPEQGRFTFIGSIPFLERTKALVVSDNVVTDGDAMAIVAAPVVTAQYHYGFSGEIGAGTYDRRAVEDVAVGKHISLGQAITSAELLDNGVSQIDDNRTYHGLPDSTKVQNMTLQAANQRRPYVRLKKDWELDTDAFKNSFLVLDGIWIGADADVAIVLKGDYECVVIRNCTIDPGGGVDITGNKVATVTLQIEGHVEQLIIDHSIMGPIVRTGSGELEQLTVSDSIVQSISGGMAIDSETTAACMERVTVFGKTVLHTIMASEVLMTDICTITDTQQGCFRFSAAPLGSRVPRSFPYPLQDFTQANNWFTSMEFGRPGYGKLSAVAPLEIQRGAENGAELGAFASLLNPIKLDSLQIKVAEYMPFGLIPMFILET